jgi:hypothetical protein
MAVRDELTIDDNYAFVAAMQAAADDAIALLTTEAIKWTYTVLTPVEPVGEVEIVSADLAPPDAALPALTTLTLPTFVPFDYATVVVPTLPSAPSLAGATTTMWSETFWTNLKTRLAAFTENITSADTVDTAVNTLTSDLTKMNSALYAKDYERRAQVLRDLYSAADAKTGSKGFTFPNSMTTGLYLEAQQKFQFDMSQTSRDIVTHIFDWAKSVQQFSLQQGISAHNADIDFKVRYLNTVVTSYSATVNAMVDKYKAEIMGYVSQAEATIKEYIGEASALTERVKTLNDISIKQGEFELAKDKANADIAAEDAKIKIADFKARVDNFLETSKIDLHNRDSNNKNQITAASAAAQAALAMAAGASNIVLTTKAAP